MLMCITKCKITSHNVKFTIDLKKMEYILSDKLTILKLTPSL